MTVSRRRRWILAIFAAAGLALAGFFGTGTFQDFMLGRVAAQYEEERARIDEAEREAKAARLAALEQDLRRTFHPQTIDVTGALEGAEAGPTDEHARLFRPGLSVPPPAFASRTIVPPPEVSGDDAVTINRTIASAAPPAEIVLSEGVYVTRSPIRLKSGVVLKGAGMRKTIILSKSPRNCVNVAGTAEPTETVITSGYAPGSSLLEVTSTRGFRAGQTARIYFDESTYRSHNENHTFGHIVRIAKVTPPTGIEVDAPLRLTYESGHTPKLRGIHPIVRAGIEDLTIELDPDAGRRHTIFIDNASDCWVRNCELSYSAFSHIWVKSSKNLLFEGNYVHHGWGYTGAPLWGYGLCLEAGTADCLVTDNVFETLRHAMIVKVGANGNVFAYNYSFGDNPQKDKGGSADFSAHGGYPYMNLVEGNVLQFAHSSDKFSSAGPLQTFFRNRVEGKGILISLASHFPVIVGNEFEKSTAYVEPDNVGATIFGNVERSRTVPPKIIYEGRRCFRHEETSSEGTALVPSLFLERKPEFLEGIPWPCFGPDVKAGDVRLPAQKRHEELYSTWPERAVKTGP